MRARSTRYVWPPVRCRPAWLSLPHRVGAVRRRRVAAGTAMVVAGEAVAKGLFRRTEPEERRMARITEILGGGTAPATDGEGSGRMPAVKRLAKRTAIVTGASPNIGGVLAHGLAQAGARVVCTDVVADVAERCAANIVAAG